MAACSQQCRSKRSSSSKFCFLLRVFAMAWESDAQEIDLWAAVRTVMLADDMELGNMFDRVPLRDLVRHQVTLALAIERSLASEDPPSPHCAASAALTAQVETASSSSGPGPFFAKQSTQSAAAQQLAAKAAPAVLDEFAISKTQDLEEHTATLLMAIQLANTLGPPEGHDAFSRPYRFSRGPVLQGLEPS